ncbi:MAG: hypothetical protein K0M50_17550 [Prolixibacteraceae bacterium]|nr:hypothetical protein [Prolixibacteraceae bacterium]
METLKYSTIETTGFKELSRKELENIRSGEMNDEERYIYLLKHDPDDDLARAITAEQLLERVIPRIEKMFEK